MSKRKEKILGELGFTYAGLSGKTQKDFGRGKPFIPFMNIMANGKIDPKFMGRVEVAPNERQNAVQKGDLFFTTSSETPEEVGMTSVLLEDIGECYLNSFCFGFRLYNFDDLIPEFAPYLFRGNEVREQIINLGQGYTRFNLPKTELLKKLKLELPTENEQKKISEILTKADSIIEKTQAAIAKYKAIKQGMLQDLFTRGIDLNTKKLRPRYQDAPELYKESKLGWIPREWEEKELSYYLDFISYGFTNPMPETQDGPFLVTAANVNGGRIQYETARKTSKSAFDTLLTDKSRPKVNDILLTKDGTLGRVAIVEKENLCINQSVAVLRPNKLVNPIFLKILLESPTYQKLMLDDSRGSAIKHIYITDVDKMKVAFPSLEEQQKIAERLKAIDNKLQTEQTYLQKIQSLKKGLMEDLLSGKKQVKVNEAATV